MKKALHTLLLVGIGTFLSAQIHVNSTATGANDGTSWDNAYTSLLVALANTNVGDEVWVASGTYKPSDTLGDSTSTFSIANNIELYGGFAGTETSKNNRDLDANVTILDGDFNGDDVVVDPTLNRLDNAWHVITVQPNIIGSVSIDGFVIKGGSTRIDFTQAAFNERFIGGGILANSIVNVRLCEFTGNLAWTGAGIGLNGVAASGSQISQCSFSANRGESQSAGICLINANDCAITECVFTNNLTTRGAIYPVECNNTAIRGCRFESNRPTDVTNFGGAYFSWQSTNTLIESCEFIDNQSGSGGVVYDDGRNLPLGVISTYYLNCSFKNNSANNWGGGVIYSWMSSYAIEGCEFAGNSAVNTGGAIYMGGNAKSIAILNSSFESNLASGGWGGAITHYGDTSELNILNCEFSSNSAVTSGGAVTTGFSASTAIGLSTFEGNTARFGGAVYCQNDTSTVTVFESTFEGNTASDAGGAIALASGNDPDSAFHIISGCRFELNVTQGDGGAVAVFDFDDSDQERNLLVVAKSIFLENFADVQGGAMYTSNAQVLIQSSLMAGNAVLVDGIGGAISHNASGMDSSTLVLFNTTIADNVGSFANGISSWTDPTGKGVVVLLNTILNHQDNTDWVIEGGSPVAISIGGNMAGSSTLAPVFIATNDLIGSDPKFADPSNFDYHLNDDSPCVNTGIVGNAHIEDLDDNPIVGIPDKGCYENQIIVSFDELSQEDINVSIYPVPVDDVVTLSFGENKLKTAMIKIRDINGRPIILDHVNFNGQSIMKEYNLATFPTGTYLIEIASEGRVFSKRVIKK